MNNVILYNFKSIMSNYKLNLVCPFIQVVELEEDWYAQRFYIKQFLESFGEESEENKTKFIRAIAGLISDCYDGYIVYWDDYDRMHTASEIDDVLYRIQESINKNKEFFTFSINSTQIKPFLRRVMHSAFNCFFYENKYMCKSLQQQMEKILIEDINCSDLYFDTSILTIFLGKEDINCKKLKETYLKEVFDIFKKHKTINYKALNENIYNDHFYVGFGTYNTIHISSYGDRNILNHLFENPKDIEININCILCVLKDVITDAIGMFIEELC